MMKNWLVVLLLVGLNAVSPESFAQRFRQQNYAQFTAGFSDIGPMVSGRYIYNFQSELAGAIGGGVTFGSVADVNLTTVFADGLASFAFYERGQSVYLSLTMGISLATDFLSEFQSDQELETAYFTYGVLAGLEAEFKVSRQLSFVIDGNQRHYFRETFDEKTRWRFQASAGIRFSL